MKKQDGYDLTITRNSKKLEFRFTSVGSKGSIHKIIEFYPMGNKRWNLGFGDVEVDDWNDNVITDNGDLRKVLQTVTNAVYTFFELHSDHEVYIEPLDYQRKLLYNRIFKQKWHEIQPVFVVEGGFLDSSNPELESYNPKTIYDYFLVRLKI